MSEVVIPVAKPVLAFARRNAGDERIKQAEDEIESLKNPKSAEEQQDEQEDQSLSAEERTFKKRYGDLRRHTQKMQEDFQKQLTDVKEQLTKTTTKQIQIPKNEKEIDAWAAEYPDVYKLVKSIAIREAKEQTTSIEARMKKIDEMEHTASRDKAEVELMRLHPDFDSIRDDDDFHEWVSEQPLRIQQALYENDTDARDAARAIDLYKADRNIKTKKSSASREAAQSVSIRSKSVPTGDGTEGLIYESQIDKMSASEYERNKEAIHTAIKSNKLVYDMSGAAR